LRVAKAAGIALARLSHSRQEQETTACFTARHSDRSGGAPCPFVLLKPYGKGNYAMAKVV
jgi:hypothetical protein